METTEKAIPRFSRQNPVTFYLRTLLYMFMALVMRVVAFLPLGALLLFPQGSPWRWLAVLCPLLLLLFILPQRFSFAQALVQTERERRFSFDKATSVQGYGAKLGQSLLHALHILLWAIPLGLMLAAGYYFYSKTDAITLMSSITTLGANVVNVLYSIANFFIGIFGGTLLIANGGLMDGFMTIAVLLALGVLVILWGALRNSSRRYIWALATRMGKDPATEARRRLRGHRWAQLGVGLINFILWIPALFVVLTTLKGMLSDFSNVLFSFFATKKLNLPELSTAVGPLLFAFFVCYLPLLPVRRILTAFFATRKLRHVAEQPEPIKEEPSWEPTAPVTVQKTDDAVAASAVVAPVTAAQTYETYTVPTQEEEDEPTPIKPPVPAYEPYHAAEAEVVQRTKPEPQPEAVVQKTEPAYSYSPVESQPAPEASDSAVPEEPLAAEQEDFFAQPYHSAQSVADDTVDAEDATEKPVAPSAAYGDEETDK